jgi:tRNA dimethylallyltransferase
MPDLIPQTNKHLIVISGPTGIGKTETAIRLAQHFGTEIISADSRQFYRELKIGTATPSQHELSQARHHFIGHLSIHEDYNIYQYEKDALNLLNELFQNHSILVLVGGSGLYIDAVCKGIDDIPDVEQELRDELGTRLEKEGLEALRQELKHLDPQSYANIDLKNPKRIIRALEVCLSTGLPFSSFKSNPKKHRDFQVHPFVLTMNRDDLYKRIEDRVDHMIDQGLEDEARNFYPLRNLNALKTVGYTEFFEYFDHTIDYSEAIRLIKRNSRRYAKRQLSWFGRNPEASWINRTTTNQVTLEISQRMAEFL